MMNESSKTNKFRSPSFAKSYFQGRVIDIGAGQDIVCPGAEPFDIEHGDANHILDFREARAYDCVHSSHCLEHMINPKAALFQWWGLVKTGGHLIVVVPEESLYEQGYWPSLFNIDHKHTFRLNTRETWSPASYDIYDLCLELENAIIVEAGIQNHGYNSIFKPSIRPHGKLSLFYCKLMTKTRARAFRSPLLRFFFDATIVRICQATNCPVDQTLGEALAQIQIIVQKAP